LHAALTVETLVLPQDLQVHRDGLAGLVHAEYAVFYLLQVFQLFLDEPLFQSVVIVNTFFHFKHHYLK
jgi:hypothetical protein